MKIAIMQPYFFPYLGYFDLINYVDLFVVYDTVQYIKHGWIHRNRILKPNKFGWQYIHVPTDKSSFYSSYKTPILDIKIFQDAPWKERILRQIGHYRQEAPYSSEMIRFVDYILQCELSKISQLNVYLLEQFCEYLKIQFDYIYASKINLDNTRSAEERILDLCDYLGAKEYVNLPGGEELYDIENFTQRNIKLTFRKLPTLQYDTGSYQYIPNLSIIDVLMWNKPEVVKQYLDDHKISKNKSE